VKQSRTKVQGTLETLAAVMTPIVVLASAIWVGLLALANVRERRTEIGLLRALGKRSRTIASLFLGKAVLLGLLGAAVGATLGVWTARLLGVNVLGVTADYFSVQYGVLLAALLGAPLLSALASYLPTLSALMQDPAVVLREV
jgi:putative ABC transport system permease protein